MVVIMIVELNIRLDVRGARNSVADTEGRARLALDILDAAGLGPVEARRHDVQVEHPTLDQLELHQNLVVRVDVQGNMVYSIRSLIYAMAETLEQDCIAIYMPRSGKGDLIGPRLGGWPDGFDINQFTNF
jgi:hypothetical protein